MICNFHQILFGKFAEQFGFQHAFSSPRFPQSDGEAERAVQTVKNLLKKSINPYLALPTYRTTPLQSGSSPAQLLMGRKLRTTVPATNIKLTPNWDCLKDFILKVTELEFRQRQCFDNCHRVCDMPQFLPNIYVYITDDYDNRKKGRFAFSKNQFLSCVVKTEHHTLIRNRKHFRVLPSQSNRENGFDSDPDLNGNCVHHITTTPVDPIITLHDLVKLLSLPID